jgi:hypothetical protein
LAQLDAEDFGQPDQLLASPIEEYLAREIARRMKTKVSRAAA